MHYCRLTIGRSSPGTHENIRVYLIFLETTIIGYILPQMTWSIFVDIFMVGSVIFVYFRNSDVSAVQGYPRSLILAPIESAYATSY